MNLQHTSFSLELILTKSYAYTRPHYAMYNKAHSKETHLINLFDDVDTRLMLLYIVYLHLPTPCSYISLQWCHNELDGVSSHQPHDCLRVNSPHKRLVTRKMFPFDDVIMTVLFLNEVYYHTSFTHTCDLGRISADCMDICAELYRVVYVYMWLPYSSNYTMFLQTFVISWL